MDLLDLAILALRIALVALLYLFVGLVIRFAAQSLKPAQRHQLRLEVVDAGSSALAQGKLIVVSDGAVLGRTEDADLVVSDATVSVEHARVRRVGRAWVIADLGSTNGTRVNDSPVKGETPLAVNDVLGLGNVRLRVVAPR